MNAVVKNAKQCQQFKTKERKKKSSLGISIPYMVFIQKQLIFKKTGGKKLQFLWTYSPNLQPAVFKPKLYKGKEKNTHTNGKGHLINKKSKANCKHMNVYSTSIII